MKKNKISKRKSKRKKSDHLKGGVGFSLSRSSFDSGCGPHSKIETRSSQIRKTIKEQLY